MDKGKIMLAEFIECYKQHSLLWDVNHPDYQKRGKKEIALEELVQIMRQFKMSATTEDVKKKINTLRCSYRKEMRRRQEAEEVGEIYKSNIWWLPLLNFIEQYKTRNEENLNDMATIYEEIIVTPKQKEKLETRETTKTSKATNKTSSKRTHDESSQSDEKSEDYHVKYEYLDISPNYEEVLIPTKTKKYSTLAETQTTRTTTTAETKKGSIQKANDALSISSTPTHNTVKQNILSSKRKSKSRHHSMKTAMLRYDHFDYLTKIWSNKLRKISGNQLLLAEKAINDILFEAEMGTLTHKFSQPKPEDVPSINYVVNVESSSIHAESEEGGESLDFIEGNEFESD